MTVFASSPRKKARLAFASAIALLFLSGIAAAITIVRLLNNQKWVSHTYAVQLALGDLQTVISNTGRFRLSYINSGAPQDLAQYVASKSEIRQKLSLVGVLILDNPAQRALMESLANNIDRRIVLMDSIIETRKSGVLNDAVQQHWNREIIPIASEFTNVVQQMLEQEETLLSHRQRASGFLFALALSILIAMFVLAVILLWIHFQLLSRELAERERMEEGARRLSARVLHLQDEERRKFSRELHDSLGQILSVAKMHIAELRERNPQDSLLVEVEQLLDQSINETRTISHLLHPPLLDEIGLASAARWYLEGFAKRSGIAVTQEIELGEARLPRNLELALFRVLQESLTNIHRHAKSACAEVSLRKWPESIVVLRVRDFGRGIAPDTLQNFLTKGIRMGVGLAGIRERVWELGGKFALESDPTGTTLKVTLPLVETTQSSENFAQTPAD